MSANRWVAPEPLPFSTWSASWSQTPVSSSPLPTSKSQQAVPLSCYWGNEAGARPVPIRVLSWSGRSSTARGRHLRWHATQNCPEPSLFRCHERSSNVFDLTFALRQIIRDIIVRVPELGHIRLEQVHIGVTRSRPGRTGLLARITPMRFAGGQLWIRSGNSLFTLQRYWLNGTELLYLIAFCIPRFLDLSFEEKMITILHELCHIPPCFNGDLHRHAGRYCLHTRSKKAYDQRMAYLARAYLNTQPDEKILTFLRLDTRHLLQRYTAIVAEWLPNPRILRWPGRIPPQSSRTEKVVPGN